MTPDRAEAAAVACEGLAAHASPDDRYRAHVVDCLCWVPITHPMRHGEDAVLEFSHLVAAGDASPEELRAMAKALRAGAPEMRATGWGWML